jgi:hypothetical protein
MSTTLSVVNEALGEISAQYTVTGTLPDFDGSPAGVAAGLYYQPVIDLVLREQDWEFSRLTAPLSPSGIAVVAPFTSSWAYPSDCVRVRQLAPAAWNVNDPQPVRWSVQDNSDTRVIFSTLPQTVPPTAYPNIVYSSNNVTVAQWDAIFKEAFVRMLASVTALALGGRPDLAREKLKEGGELIQTGGGLDS